MNINYFTFAYAGLGLIILELLIGVNTGFDLVLLGISLLMGGFSIWITDNVWTGIAITTILTFAYLFIGRKLIKKTLFKTLKKTNIDRLLDQKGLVVKKITPSHPGQVKIEGEIWRAQSGKTINTGKNVNVKKIKGVTLIVN